MYFSKLRCFLNNLYNVHIGDIEMPVYHFCSAISSIRLHVIILHCLASINVDYTTYETWHHKMGQMLQFLNIEIHTYSYSRI